MSSYSEGFKLGYSANAPLAGISEGIQKFTKEYRKQEEIGRQRQEAYDQARSEFKKKQEETYGKYAKEDLYDNTGFTDFDTLGDKFTKSARETYEINEFAFRNGFIDESELTARNNTLKAQSQKLTTLYNDANAFIEEKKKLEEEGQSNPLNDKKLEILEDFSKQVKVSSGLDGLYLSTIGKEGKQRNISVSEFNKILNSESGVDLNSTYENLLSNQGFTQRLASGKKITEFITEEGDDMTALDAQLLTMTDGQQLGALLSITDTNGNYVATTDEEEAKKKGIIHVDAARVIDPSISVEEQKKLKSTMIDQLRAMQERKKKTEIYNDPYRVRKTASQSVKEDTMRAAYEIALKIGEGGEDANRLVDQVVANNEGIENMFLDEGSDSYIVETIDKNGRRSDFSIKVPRNEDGSVDSRNLGVSLMSAISPSYSVEQAELAARDFEKKNPSYQFANSTSAFDRDYIPLPRLSSIETNVKNVFADDLIRSNDPDDLLQDIPKALLSLGIDRGYKIEIDKSPSSFNLPPTMIGGGQSYYDEVVKITIPGVDDPVFIKASSKEEVIDMIPDIAYKIKKSGNLIDNRSNRVQSAGKKKLPTG